MVILISMNNGENFTFDITEENYKTFKTDTEIYIRKENISYYGLV